MLGPGDRARGGRLAIDVDAEPARSHGLVDAAVQAALRVARDPQHSIDLALLDIMMPIMNGQEFYAEHQRDPALASIPVVVISADKNVALKATGIRPSLHRDIKAIQPVCGAA